MKAGVILGMAVCIALTSAAGAVLAFFAVLFVCPPLLVVFTAGK